MLYRATKQEAKPGQLRVRAWNASLNPPTSDTDPLWSQRCKDYWERQERLYGWRLSDFTMVIGEESSVLGRFPVVSTAAVILEILPGERTTDHSRVTAEMVSGRQ